MVEEAIQDIVESEFADHMGRKPYEHDKGRATHRDVTSRNTVSKTYLYG